MRRVDREIKDMDAMIRIMEKCDMCRLALHDAEYPYILPLNFGMEVADGEIALYFHCASEGKKLDLIARDNRVGFEMDTSHRLVTDADRGYCTMEYESVIGCGKIEILPEEEKYRALEILMQHYHKGDFHFDPAAIPKTTLLKLSVERITGKAHMRKSDA